MVGNTKVIGEMVVLIQKEYIQKMEFLTTLGKKLTTTLNCPLSEAVC